MKYLMNPATSISTCPTGIGDLFRSRIALDIAPTGWNPLHLLYKICVLISFMDLAIPSQPPATRMSRRKLCSFSNVKRATAGSGRISNETSPFFRTPEIPWKVDQYASISIERAPSSYQMPQALRWLRALQKGPTLYAGILASGIQKQYQKEDRIVYKNGHKCQYIESRWRKWFSQA